MASENDKKLQNQGLREGDSDAWGRLYRRSNWNVRKAVEAYRYPDPMVDADDAAQNAWLSLYNGKSSIEADTPMFVRAQRIAGNRAVDQLRASTRVSGRRGTVTRLNENGEVLVEDPGDTEDKGVRVEDDAIEPLINDDLKDKIACIVKHPGQTSVVLAWLDGDTYAEVGNKLGITSRSVDNKIIYAKKKLKRKADVFIEDAS